MAQRLYVVQACHDKKGWITVSEPFKKRMAAERWMRDNQCCAAMRTHKMPKGWKGDPKSNASGNIPQPMDWWTSVQAANNFPRVGDGLKAKLQAMEGLENWWDLLTNDEQEWLIQCYWDFEYYSWEQGLCFCGRPLANERADYCDKHEGPFPRYDQ